jgi:hypothetical protein
MIANGVEMTVDCRKNYLGFLEIHLVEITIDYSEDDSGY